MATAKQRHPQVFVEKHEDPWKRKRIVPMKVLSLGMSRTGTMTMKAAFEILDLPTWHWVTMSENPPDMVYSEMWHQAFLSKFEPERNIARFTREQYDSLLSNWSATTDYPPSMLAAELMEAYPEAKLILVQRDIERWYKSFSNTVIQGTANPFIPLLTMIDKTYIGAMAALTDIVAKHYFHVRVSRTRYWVFNNPEFFAQWRENAREVYRAHNAEIRRIAPEGKLLLFDFEEGWEPLCRFLGKEVPSVPFPRVNETEAVQEKVNLYIMEGYRRSLVRFARKAVPVMVAVFSIWLCLWWSRP